MGKPKESTTEFPLGKTEGETASENGQAPAPPRLPSLVSGLTCPEAPAAGHAAAPCPRRETKFAIGEKRAAVLTLQQTEALLLASLKPKNRACALPVGMMLWAGIRPCELARIRWIDFAFPDNCIIVSTERSWDECARLAPIHPVLVEWMYFVKPICLRIAPIIPCSWGRRWRRLRTEAGLGDWTGDGLRHTFAVYHDRYFHDSLRLQQEIGANGRTVRNMLAASSPDVTQEEAKIYWEDMVRRIAGKAAAAGA